MNPGLAIKLRPTGPWRIGPDSGARNSVDVIYHSDSLYSAVASAMARFGLLDDWLNATARTGAPAVCFSSCFPFVDEIGYVVPPRTIWPPRSPGALSARVRWKSARFVPLGIVQAMLTGQVLDENHWAVDGVSECLVPAGRSGPFRTGVRWNAAVDRLSGATERHSTACMEFRPGGGLWTIVAFADEAARDRWLDPIKSAFRLLADSGFGGERSRGWGRSEAPEFIEGSLPGMILGNAEATPVTDADEQKPESVPPVETPSPVETSAGEAAAAAPATEPDEPLSGAAVEAVLAASAGSEETRADEVPPEPAPAAAARTATPEPGSLTAHWLLSLFTPAPADAVDWGRGNYSVVVRSGRVESPSGSGELKKQLHMVTEGSVLYAENALRGSAPDVAPDGFAHPVFRAGFALSIPLPEVS
ncbi:MAG TPA: hypothetical protein VG675_04410 [Bryobacteraceae bacterium]|nr:hypothetical protein [Bryobacteraceae bacterium]